MTYWGRHATVTIMAMSAPHVVVEVADFMQEEIVEDLHAAWPACPEHQLGTYAEIADERAVWFCRKHQHVVAAIGQLAR